MAHKKKDKKLDPESGETALGIDRRGIVSHTTDGGTDADPEDIVPEADEGGMESMVAKAKKLRAELKACHAQKQEYLAGWQRAKADLINARKEEEVKRKEYIQYGEESLLSDIIPVLDSFDMAFSNRQAWEKVDENWRTGVLYIHSQLLAVLKQRGVLPFDPSAGEPFDPLRHTPMESVPVTDKAKDQTVVAVMQKGYLFGEKILRPAKVKVGEFKK